MNENLRYIDLFAGAGGLSEGFIREGFVPVTHLEMGKDACDTLRTRLSFLHLSQTNNLNPYYSYLKKEETEEEIEIKQQEIEQNKWFSFSFYKRKKELKFSARTTFIIKINEIKINKLV